MPLWDVVTLVDFSAFYCRCQVHHFRKGEAEGRSKTDTWRHVFVSSLRKLFREWNNVVFIRDSKPLTKLAIDPGYKSGRGGPSEEIHAACQPVVANLAGVYTWCCGEEADDVLSALAHRFLNQGWDVNILSLDADLWQLAALDRCTVFDLRLKGTVSREHGVQKYGVGPERIALYKAWLGDAGDNVPGLPRIPRRLMIEFLISHCQTFEQSVQRLSHPSAHKHLGNWFEKVLAFREQAEKNWRLVKLREELPDTDREIIYGNGPELVALMAADNGRETAQDLHRRAVKNLKGLQDDGVLPILTPEAKPK